MFLAGHVFSYESISATPKPKYPPLLAVNGTEYNLINSNGFLRLRTVAGEMYHVMQAIYYYQLPDWKIHFAIHKEDRGLAWNIVAELFIEKKCKTSMKMIVPDYGVENWPEHMHGREITVYIYQHKKYYEDLKWGFEPTINDQFSKEFWLDFVAEAQARLQEHKVRALPHPEGEYSLGNYASLRNEAFIKMRPEWEDKVHKSARCEWNNRVYCYPPNEAGYNAAGHKNPLKNPVVAFFSQSISKKRRRNKVKLALQERKLNIAATAVSEQKSEAPVSRASKPKMR